MSIIIGSARRDEKSGYSGGVKGDSLQTSTPDYRGEVSMQNFYVHKKGWIIIRPISRALALKIAERMKAACNNKFVGYSQNDRYAIIRDGIDSKVPTNCDCSSLIRKCVKEASGKDPGDFTTANALQKLSATGFFEAPFPYAYDTPLHEGDILCTKTKGHIVIVTDEDKPRNGNPYPEPTKNVKLNTKGNDARWVEFQLNRHGYKLIVDGRIDQKDSGAIWDFQKKAFPNDSEEWDGIVGSKTRAKLKS